MKGKIPYGEMDANIVGLAKVLNSFDGIYTTSSCGGHQNNTPYQLPFGSWEVTFKLRPARQNSPSLDAWLSLEYLVFLFSKCYNPDKGSVIITPFSPDPYLNHPGNSISFTLNGKDTDPDKVAGWLLLFGKDYIS